MKQTWLNIKRGQVPRMKQRCIIWVEHAPDGGSMNCAMAFYAGSAATNDGVSGYWLIGGSIPVVSEFWMPVPGRPEELG